MAIEFATFKQKVFMSEDYVRFDDSKWFTYEQLDKKTIDSLFLNLTNMAIIRKYLKDIMSKGIVEPNDRVNQVRHIARKFFPKCDRIPDIDNNGRLNIECNG